MAYVWQMAVECGRQEAAERFVREFDSSPIRLADGTEVTLEPHASTIEGTWWVTASPARDGWLLCGHGGADDLEEAVRLTTVGMELYERLRRPLAYRFAVVGVEVSSSGHSFDDLRDLARDGGLERWHGAVLGRELASAAAGAPWLQPFSADKLWVPWRGEEFPR